MMPMVLKRVLGFILTAIGAIGIILGAVGIQQIWQVKAELEPDLLNSLASTQETLEVTQTGLSNATSSLDTINSSITNLNNTILTVAQSLNDAAPILDSVATLLKEELPTTLLATQTSLETAEASANLLDGVMRALTAIPFYPGEPYNPEVPLHVSVQNVAASLETLPESLIDIGEDLEANQANFSDIEDDLIALSVTLTGINANISSAKSTINEYQMLLTSLGTQIDLLEGNVPSILSSLAWYLSILILWLLFTQVGLVLQGLSLAGVEIFRPTTSIASE